MPRATVNGIEIEYATHGSKSDPAVLMVNGYTSQMTTGYEPEFAELIAARGRFVIRYDNRDVGLTTHLDDAPAPYMEIMAARKNRTPMPPVAYTLSEMAADGIGLLGALGIDAAHIVGSSMGGMLVQTMAIEHPNRVLSMTSIMSTTGEPDFGRSSPEANAALMGPVAATVDEYVASGVIGRKIWSSKKYFDSAHEAARLRADWERGIDPSGNARQLCAIMASSPRVDRLRELRVPTLVIHGRDDTLIDMTGGLRTAELVPGAMLALMNDMGHDLPKPLWAVLVDLIVGHQDRATNG
jgi:pimeloyl-ACP methyl ester carboxylesterase